MSYLMSETIQRGTAGKPILWVSDDYQMKSIDRLVKADSLGGVITLILPSFTEGASNFYYVEAPVGATNAVTVVDEDGTTVGLLDTDGDYQLLYGTGTAWVVVVDGITP